MSFIRPEAAAFLARWAETAAVAAISAIVIWHGARAGLAGSPLGWAAAAVALLVGGVAARAAALRAYLGSTGEQRVFAREGRIIVLGPFGAQKADIDTLARVELSQGRVGPAWMLTDDAGGVVAAPFAFDPERQALDALSTLPGFSQDAAAAALSRGVAHTVLWRRPKPQPEILPPL